MARSHHRISGAPPGPPFYLCLCLSPVSAQGRNHVQMDKPTVRQKDYERIDRGCPRPPPLRAGRPFHPGVHEPWKTYQSHSRMNSWIFSIARNYGRLGYISQTAESVLRTSVINFSIVKNDEITDTNLHTLWFLRSNVKRINSKFLNTKNEQVSS